MRVRILCLALVPVVTPMSACSDEPDPLYTAEATVAATRVPCTGIASQLCMQVSESGGPFERFYGRIEGFEFHWGRETTLRYRVYAVDDPPEDAPSLRYELDAVIDVDFDALGPTFELEFPDPDPGSPWFDGTASAGEVRMIDTSVACDEPVCAALLAQESALVVTFELAADDAVPLRATTVAAPP